MDLSIHLHTHRELAGVELCFLVSGSKCCKTLILSNNANLYDANELKTHL